MAVTNETQIADDANAEDFYFTCSELKCTLKASTCEKNRNMSAKSEYLLLNKQSAKCRKCKAFEQEQQAGNRISIDAYHAQVLSEAQPEKIRKPLIRDVPIREQRIPRARAI